LAPPMQPAYRRRYFRSNTVTRTWRHSNCLCWYFIYLHWFHDRIKEKTWKT